MRGAGLASSARLAHVAEVLQRERLRDAPAALQRLARQHGPALHVVHHQQHLVAAGVVDHLLRVGIGSGLGARHALPAPDQQGAAASTKLRHSVSPQPSLPPPAACLMGAAAFRPAGAERLWPGALRAPPATMTALRPRATGRACSVTMLRWRSVRMMATSRRRSLSALRRRLPPAAPVSGSPFFTICARARRTGSDPDTHGLARAGSHDPA